MNMTEATYRTKLPANECLIAFLEADARLMSQLERQFYVDWVVRGEDPDELVKQYLVFYKINTRQANSIRKSVEGKIEALKECQKRQIADLQGQIKSAKGVIRKWDKTVKNVAKRQGRKRNPIFPAPGSQQALRFKIHNKKRRVAQLEARLKRLQNNPSRLIFGGRKLWKTQFHLDTNGHDSHEGWRRDWDSHRASGFLCVGRADDRLGNANAQLDLEGNLRLRVPYCLEEPFGSWVELRGVNFPYGQEAINQAIQGGRKLTHRFISKGGTWYLHTTVDLPLTSRPHRPGMMGVDLNPDEIGWAISDRDGNLVKAGCIRYDLKGKSSNQSEQILALAVKELVEIALEHQVPITIEKLDFTEKKQTLRERGKHYASMLSGFAYNKFYQLLTSRCNREGVKLLRCNAAYSSLIGIVKLMPMYGLNSATAAALVLARRGQRFSERLPARVTRLLQVDDTRHVWNYWRTLSKKLKGLARHSFFDSNLLEQVLEVTPSMTAKVADRQGATALSTQEVSRQVAFGLPSG